MILACVASNSALKSSKSLDDTNSFVSISANSNKALAVFNSSSFSSHRILGSGYWGQVYIRSSTGEYSYSQIVAFFNMHFTTVGKIVRAAKASNDKKGG